MRFMEENHGLGVNEFADGVAELVVELVRAATGAGTEGRYDAGRVPLQESVRPEARLRTAALIGCPDGQPYQIERINKPTSSLRTIQ